MMTGLLKTSMLANLFAESGSTVSSLGTAASVLLLPPLAARALPAEPEKTPIELTRSRR